MTVYVEFLGLPGSGKTHACRLMLQELAARKIPFSSVEARAFAVLMRAENSALLMRLLSLLPRKYIYPLLRLPPSNRVGLKYDAFQSFCEEHADFANLLFEREESRISPIRHGGVYLTGMMMEIIWSHRLAAAHSDDLRFLVRDEAFAQRAISLYAYQDTPPDRLERNATAYFSAMPLPDALIVTGTASLSVIASRLRQRGYPLRMRHLSPAEQDETLARMSRIVEIGREVLRRRGCRLVEIGNDGSLADFETALRARVGDLVSA